MEFKEIAQMRRAVNFFDPSKKVPKELISEMLEIAAMTPSSYNLQPWSLIVVTEQEEKKRLRQAAFDQPKITDAPHVFIVLADRDAWKQGHHFADKNFKEMVKAGSKKEEDKNTLFNTWKTLYGESLEKQQAFANKNTAFFAMSLMYAAKSLGLDTHPMDGFDHEGVREAFNIPSNFWVPLLMAVGYFDESKRLNAPKWRKTAKEIIVSFNTHRS